ELLRLELGEPRRSGRVARRSDATERWSIDRLIPYAKKRTDPHRGAGRRDRREYSPARQLGIAEIPVMVAAGWSEAQKRAYVLADNQLAITGSGWDPELLRLELGELKQSMARGGARPGGGRPAGKSPNPSPPSTRARARARDGTRRRCPSIRCRRRAICGCSGGIV